MIMIMILRVAPPQNPWEASENRPRKIAGIAQDIYGTDIETALMVP